MINKEIDQLIVYYFDYIWVFVTIVLLMLISTYTTILKKEWKKNHIVHTVVKRLFRYIENNWMYVSIFHT